VLKVSLHVVWSKPGEIRGAWLQTCETLPDVCIKGTTYCSTSLCWFAGLH
jgi:hypothetical protein